VVTLRKPADAARSLRAALNHQAFARLIAALLAEGGAHGRQVAISPSSPKAVLKVLDRTMSRSDLAALHQGIGELLSPSSPE
jgi:hypothetical protein